MQLILSNSVISSLESGASITSKSVCSKKVKSIISLHPPKTRIVIYYRIIINNKVNGFNI